MGPRFRDYVADALKLKRRASESALRPASVIRNIGYRTLLTAHPRCASLIPTSRSSRNPSSGFGALQSAMSARCWASVATPNRHDRGRMRLVGANKLSSDMRTLCQRRVAQSLRSRLDDLRELGADLASRKLLCNYQATKRPQSVLLVGHFSHFGIRCRLSGALSPPCAG
jgi:hypothetical protein